MFPSHSGQRPSRRSAALRFVWGTTLVLFSWVALANLAGAQDIFGRISGTVTDPSGAVMANVKVAITNEETRLTRTVMTDEHGFYVATDLPVGSYIVATEFEGFKTVKKTGYTLVAGGRLTVDVLMQVGAVSDVVDVVAQGEIVNTTSGEISRTVDTHQVQKVALNQRNYAQLVSMIPGSALTNFDQTAMTTGMSTTASSVNGLRADGNLFSIDGGFNMDGGSNGTQLNNVGIDFIREVTVAASNYSAEYGRNDGASVNVVTRSGGNQFHGSVFEFVRNDMFDAASPASKLNATPTTPERAIKPALRFNDFGWNVGGPVKRNKLFFFAGQEWKKIRQSATPQNLTVPTTAEMAGNFSAITGLTLKTPPNAPAGCTIVNNVMSAQCITPDGQAIANVYKVMATKVATSFSNTPTANNATFQPNNPQNWREDIIRVDYQAGKHNLYYRYIHDSLNLIDAFGTFAPSGTLPTSPTNRIRPGYSNQGAHIWTITSHLVNEAKLNASWNKQRIPPTGPYWQRSTYGFQTAPPLGLVGSYPDGIPHVTFTGIGGSFPTAAPAQFTGPYFSLLAPTVDITPSDNLTWQRGSHTLKFGAMYARNRKDQNSRPDSYNGRITFSTSGNPNTTGNPFADALMGNFQSYAQQSADPVGHFRYNNFQAYVNDSWKFSRNLSLELGLRYEHTGPTYAQGNNMANFDPRQYNPAQAPTSIGTNNVPVGGVLNQGFVTTGLVRPGNVPSSQYVRVPNANSAFVQAVPATAARGFLQPENVFAPRIGFSYAPRGDKTAIRGGFGMFYDKPEGNIIFGQPGVVPFLQSVTYQNANLANPSAGVGIVPTIFGMSAVDQDFVVARSMQYSLSIQQELPYGILADAAYVGNQQRHLVRQPNINLPSFATAIANAGKTTNQERPYLGYADITQFRSDGNANYNALQLYATKRKGDITAAVSYTWSKALGQVSGINANPEPECAFSCQLPGGQTIPWGQFYYGPLTFDIRHIFVANYSYAFPFFRNQHGLANAALGGWEISGITRMQSGTPLLVSGNQTIGPAGSGVTQFNRRANAVAGVPLYSGYTCPTGKICWFNPAAFAAAPANGVGNAPNGNITGPGYQGWDLSLRKNFKLPTEGVKLQFRADAFNLFNHTNWANPGTNATGGGFGQISGSAPPRQLQFGARFSF
jgi:hypothetical protein